MICLDPLRTGSYRIEACMHLIEEDDTLIKNDGILGYSFYEGNVIIDCINKALSFLGCDYDYYETLYYKNTAVVPAHAHKVLSCIVLCRCSIKYEKVKNL